MTVFWGVVLGAVSVRAAEPGAIAWFEPAGFSPPRLAPNGRWVGAVFADQNQVGWWAQDLSTNTPASSERMQGGGKLAEFTWTADGTAVLRGQNAAGSPQWWRTGNSLSQLGPLFGPSTALGSMRVLRPQPALTKAVLIEGSSRRGVAGPGWDVYSLSLTNGLLSPVAQNSGDVGQWLVDDTGKVRLALAIRGRTQELRVAPRVLGAVWPTAFTFDFVRDPARLLGISADGQRAWLAARLGRDTRGIYEMELTSLRVVQARWTDPDFDFDGSLITRGSEIVAVNYNAERPATAWLGGPWPTALKGRIEWRPAALSDDDLRGLFSVVTDRQPLRWEWFDRATGNDRTVVPPGAISPPEGVAMESVQCAARDGLLLRGYLTRPAAGRANRSPLVVLVHGGPWTRDSWGWQPEVQFLAQRGWSVLQINYRGSSGFGWAFQERGAGRWTEAADDLVDAANWAIERGYADRDRVTIAGASFGGFLATQALTRNGQPFRAAASIGGVFDLRQWLQESARREPDYIIAAQREWLLGTVNPAPTSVRVPYGAIGRPLLLLHARDDDQVSSNQSVELAQLLRWVGRPVELSLLPSGGHTLGTPAQQAEVWERVEAFLRREVGGGW